MRFVFLLPQWVNWQALWDKWVVCSGSEAKMLLHCCFCSAVAIMSHTVVFPFCDVFEIHFEFLGGQNCPIRWLGGWGGAPTDLGNRTGVVKGPGATWALLLMEMWQMASCSLGRRTLSDPWHAQQLARKPTMWKKTKWLTLLTVVKLVELTSFRLPLAKHQVVSDVPIGVIGRLPLEDDLGRGVGWRDGVQRDRRFWGNRAEQVLTMRSSGCYIRLWTNYHLEGRRK